MRQLAAGTRAFAGLVSIAGGGKVMETADELLVLTRKPEDGRERARGCEVLAPLEVALGLPEG